MTVEVEWNEQFGEWDVTSKGPNWILTAEETRDEAIATARRLKSEGEDILVKGPNMASFKKV